MTIEKGKYKLLLIHKSICTGTSLKFDIKDLDQWKRHLSDGLIIVHSESLINKKDQ